nr:SGNH/GDSL hydrolase family protein [Arthrobacter pigmenti]
MAYGHSWVDGDGASSPSSCFTSRAAVELRLELDNRGVGGSNSTGTAALIAATPPPPASLYVLMTGLNDLRLGGESPSSARGYAAALQRIFTAIRRASPSALVVAVMQPYLLDFSLYAPHNLGSNSLIDQYNSVLRRAAAEYSRVALAEADDWDPETMLSADTVHPNDAGHASLARAVSNRAKVNQTHKTHINS